MKFSPITWLFERFFRLLQLLPPQKIMAMVIGNRSDLSEKQISTIGFAEKRAARVDYFILFYIFLDVLSFSATFSAYQSLRIIAVVWAVLRIVDILQATVNLTLFDALRGRIDNQVASNIRIIVLAFVNFIELLLCFSVIYASFPSSLDGLVSSWDALYFSVITQLTIGFGDLKPLHGLRAVAAIQGLSGIVFLALVFVRTISALPKLEELTSKGPKEKAASKDNVIK